MIVESIVFCLQKDVNLGIFTLGLPLVPLPEFCTSVPFGQASGRAYTQTGPYPTPPLLPTSSQFIFQISAETPCLWEAH